MVDIIDKMVEFVATKTNAPEMMVKLASIFVIGCTMRRKYVANLTPFPRRFNTYVAEIAKSRAKKSTVAKFASIFLQAINFPILSSNITPEAMIEEMQDIPTCALIRDEIGGDLSKMKGGGYMSGAIDMWCDLWDKYDVYKRRTRSKGIEIVEKPCFNMFMATTDVRFNTYMSNEFTLSGWLPRYMLYFMKDKDKKPYKDLEPLMDDIKRMPEFKVIVKVIERINKTKNEIKVVFENLPLLNECYKKFDVEDPNPQIDALNGRAGEQIIKLSGIFKIASMSVSEIDSMDVPNGKMIIEDKFVKKAYRFIQELLKRCKEVLGAYIEWKNASLTVKYVQQHITNQQELFVKGKINYIGTQKKDLFKITHSDKETLDTVLENLFAREAIMKLKVKFLKDKNPRVKEIYVMKPFFDTVGNYKDMIELIGYSVKFDGEPNKDEQKTKKAAPEEIINNSDNEDLDLSDLDLDGNGSSNKKTSEIENVGDKQVNDNAN